MEGKQKDKRTRYVSKAEQAKRFFALVTVEEHYTVGRLTKRLIDGVEVEIGEYDISSCSVLIQRRLMTQTEAKEFFVEYAARETLENRKDL